MTFASRMSCVSVSPTLKVSAEADRLRRAGVDVVDLGAGEPDFGTPKHVKDAAHAALNANFTKYTPAAGVVEFRDAVAHDYSSRYRVSIKADQVIISAGAKQALYNAAMVLFDRRDEVITHGPFWPTIVDQIKLADATPVVVQTHREDGFAIKAGAMIDAFTPKTKAIIVNSPCNPTGALIAEADMIAIADAAAARGIWVIADMTYEHLIYDPVPHNLVKILLDRMPDRTVICSSASKSYAMTGWRCGWAIGPKALIAQCNVLQGHSTSNINSITQKAGIAALTGPQDEVTVMLDDYRRRRDAVHGWLTADPRIVCVKPSGAFYLFPYVADLLSPTGIKTTSELAEAMLKEVAVAITPGEGFDAPGFFRLSYATSIERLREGVDRMFAFIAALEKSGKIPTPANR
ncbi:MAG: aspartate aminotransferase [Acidobacterium sp.]|nr:pyridoxal phosphate-dependent aminotransferase [Acidobacteriota bacterium]PHY11043.1 MAG: aspartate aminotransferase [Acidobacterium sp.]